MKDAVRIFEGVSVGGRPESEAQVLRLPVNNPFDGPDAAPHPVYSLDGLLALALAVRELEVKG